MPHTSVVPVVYGVDFYMWSTPQIAALTYQPANNMHDMMHEGDQKNCFSSYIRYPGGES